jgi:PAS domain S-box-containing protein
MRQLRFGTLEWSVGVYCVLTGALMLVVPHAFSVAAYATLQPHGLWWGSLFLVAGGALCGAAVLAPPRPVTTAAYLVAGGAVLLLASDGLRPGAWSETPTLSVLGVSLIVVALLPRNGRGTSPTAATPPYGGDGFVLLVGATTLLSGILVLGWPSALGQESYAVRQPLFPWLGVALCAGGALLVACQLRASPSAGFVWTAHLLAAAVMLAYAAAVSFPEQAWLDIAYYGGFAAVVAALPWLGSRVPRGGSPSLRMRLALALATAAALPLIGVVALVSHQSQAAATSQALTLQEGLAVALAEDVSDFVGLHRAATIALAAYPRILDAPPAVQDALVRDYAAAYPSAIHFSTFDEAGGDIANSDDVRRKAAGRAIFEDARQTMEPTLDVFVGSASKLPVLAFGAPVRDADGRFAGLIGSGIKSDRILSVIARASRGSNAYLVDARGRVLAHQDLALVAAGTDFAAAPPIAALWRSESTHGALSYQAASGEQLAGFARVPRLNWAVVVEQPAATALAGARSGRELAFAVLLAVIGLAIVMGALAARGLVHPLSLLAAAADRLAAGDVAAPLPVSRVREVARLADAFSQMRGSLVARTVEWEQAERALRASEERYRNIVETAQEGIAILDADDRVALANQKMADMLGYGVDDLIGLPLRTFVAADFHALAAQRRDARLRGLAEQHDVRLRRQDGSELWAIVATNPLFDADGRYAGRLGMLTDITERKRTEEERANLLLLEQAARQGLQETNHALAQATQAKSEFLATMSHELRTPLNAIIGFSELLTGPQDLPPAQRRRFATNILDSGSHLLRLVNEILDLSRVEAGCMELQLSAFEVSALLRDVDTTLRPIADKKRLVLRMEVAPDVPTLVADEGKCRQVLYNLLSNAVKFTPNGGSVATTARVVDGALEIAVADTGIGIAPRDHARVFQEFQQVDSSASRQHQGTGLGLALARRLVELQGGRIWVESVPGEGSRFSFTIPLRAAPLVESAA